MKANKSTLALMASLLGACALCLFACGGGDDGTETDGDTDVIPFGGEQFLASDTAGYYMPAVYHQNTDQILLYRNAGGITLHNFGDQSTNVLSGSEGTAQFNRGGLAVNDAKVVWQHAPTKLKIFRRGTGSVIEIAPIPSPMKPGMCIVDDYVLLMGANQKVYMFNTLSKTSSDTMPYTTASGKSSKLFTCSGGKLAVATEDGTILVADWARAGELINIPTESRREIQAAGLPQQLVMNDTYLAWVDQYNDIYVVELANLDAAPYLVVNQNDPAAGGYTQISDLYLGGKYLVWSDDTYGYWTVFYADLSSRDLQNLYRWSQMSSSSDSKKYPAADPATGIVYWSHWPAGVTEPVLWRGQVGAEAVH